MENDLFERAPIPKAYFKMALPVVFSMVISLVYNMVDTWFIARTQDTALVAGVSLCAPLFTLLVAFGDMFSLGGSSLISRLFGQKEDKKARRISAFCYYSALAFGLFAMAFMFFLRTPILHLLGADETTFQAAYSYYSWLLPGVPMVILGLVPSNTLRTEGLANEAMIGSVCGAVINIILDPILIFGLDMGAGGAALATSLSNACSNVIYLYMLRTKSRKLSTSIRDCQIDMQGIKDIFAIGFPASITNLMQSFAIMLTNRFLLPYGTENIAALGISLKINMIVMLIMVGFAFGAQALIGYNYGAGNEERLRKLIHFDLLVELVTSGICLLIFIPFAPHIIRIFMNDPAVITAGTLILRCLVITMPLMGIILVFTTLFQAAGKALPAFLLSVSRQGVFLLIAMVVLSACFHYHGVVLAQAAADVLTAVLAFWLIRKTLPNVL